MNRVRLPNRREADTAAFEHAGRRYVMTIGRDQFGEPREVFIDAGRPGDDLNMMARDLAVVSSLALQYGAPLAVLLDALDKDQDGRPAGPLGVALAMVGADQ
mgnify:FL=1